MVGGHLIGGWGEAPVTAVDVYYEANIGSS